MELQEFLWEISFSQWLRDNLSYVNTLSIRRRFFPPSRNIYIKLSMEVIMFIIMKHCGYKLTQTFSIKNSWMCKHITNFLKECIGRRFSFSFRTENLPLTTTHFCHFSLKIHFSCSLHFSLFYAHEKHKHNITHVFTRQLKSMD